MHKRLKTTRILFILTALLLTAVFLAQAPRAYAGEFRGGDTVTIAAGETINDDLYITGNIIDVQGTVNGDLIATGAQIIVNGVVTGDVLGSAQTLTISGTVEDDVRFAGILLEIADGARVGGDVLNAGYAFDLDPEGQIGGDLLVFGGQAVVDGVVGGDTTLNVGGAEVNGQIGGNASFTVAEPTGAPAFSPFMFMPNAPAVPAVNPGLIVGDAARVDGAVNVTAPTENSLLAVPGDFDADVSLTGATQAEPRNPLLDFVSDFLGRWLVLLIAAPLAFWLVGRLLRRSALFVQEEPLPSFAWGTLIYFVLPLILLAIAVAAGLIYALLGAIGLGGVGATLFFTTLLVLAAVFLLYIVVLVIVSKLVAGKAIGDFIFRSQAEPNRWLSIALGTGIIALLIAVPYLGALLNWIITVAGVGGLFTALRERLQTAEVIEKSDPIL